jgi:hypothetical protein
LPEGGKKQFAWGVYAMPARHEWVSRNELGLGFCHARTVHAAGMACRAREAGTLGNVPDILGLMGLLPRRVFVKERPPAGCYAD